MESKLARVVKLKNIKNWGIWKFQIRVILNSYGALDVALGTDIRPADLGNTANEATRAYMKNLVTWNKADATA